MPKHECSAACTKGWSPSRKCHCSLCGENFSIVKHFDKHQDSGTVLTCKPPADIGLVLNKHNVWALPGEVDFSERFQKAT